MKRAKKIYILLAVLLVVCIATVGVVKFEEKKEQIKNSDEIILQISPETVTALSWENETETLSFHKNGNWIYDEDEAFPVDEEAINELLEVFKEFGVAFVIDEVEDISQYGLDKPVCTITLTSEEQTHEIKLGAFSTMDSQRYVSIGDDKVYLVSEDPLESYDAGLSDMIAHDETPSFEKITGITFEGNESYKVIYEEDSVNTYCSSDVYFAQIDGETRPLDTELVEGFTSAISQLNPTNYVNYKVAEDELVEYGIDTPELTVTVDYSYEEEEEKMVSDTFTMHIGRNREKVKEVEESSKKAEEEGDEDFEPEEIPAYVRIGDSAIIYEISATEYDKLVSVAYDDLRHKEVLTADFEDIYQIDITLEGADYTLTSTVSEEDEKEKVWSYMEKDVDITSFKSALDNLSADSFTEEEATEKEEISLVIHLNNENHPQVEIQLYRYDGEYCLAVVDKETFGLIERSEVVDLIEAVNAIILSKG